MLSDEKVREKNEAGKETKVCWGWGWSQTGQMVKAPLKFERRPKRGKVVGSITILEGKVLNRGNSK